LTKNILKNKNLQNLESYKSLTRHHILKIFPNQKGIGIGEKNKKNALPFLKGFIRLHFHTKPHLIITYSNKN